jgi:SAM-dependent methyltransferase
MSAAAQKVDHGLTAILARHPAPHTPWTESYVSQQRELVGALLDSTEARALMETGDALPPGYGRGFDERVVEFPWLLARRPRGRVLDAGSSLNHEHILDRFQPLVDDLTITTLAPEERAFPLRGISYVYADFRDLPFRDALFDTIVSISSLEHVGMDNQFYGASDEGGRDPRGALEAALAELRRVLAPGGRLLVSVPYGAREDHGGFRQFDLDDVAHLVARSGLEQQRLDVYRYTAGGWERSDLGGAAGAVYRDFLADSSPVADLAAAARAIACIELGGASGHAAPTQPA